MRNQTRIGRSPLRRAVLLISLLGFAIAQLAFAAKLPTVRPEVVGLSTERLARIGEIMQEYVDQGRLGGAVTLVARAGKVAYLQSFGKLDPKTGAAMPTDAIFRIASQTKAVTSVAIMILFEEGRLLLDDPVSKYIPEFKDTTVAVPEAAKKGPGYKIVPAKRPITIRDLLTHTAGISYGDGPAKDLYKAAGLQGWFLADRNVPVGDLIKKLAKLPFDAQPGEKWVYGYNTDILGYLVEVVSGMSLADFIKKRITEPLGMADTSFFLPEEKAGRLTPRSTARARTARPNSSMTPVRMLTSRGRGYASPAGPVCFRRPRITPASCSCSRAAANGAASTSSARSRSSS